MGDGISIRPMIAGDIPAIQQLHHRAFSRLAAVAYSPDQLVALLVSIASDSFVEALAENSMLVAVAGDARLIATAGWCAVAGEPEVGRIRKVAVDPDLAGKGVGRAMVGASEAAILASGRCAYFVRANLNAVPFYARLGYAAVGDGAMSLGAGVSIPVRFMRKRPAT
jgi:predicted N-acetyltransferase YhbS